MQGRQVLLLSALLGTGLTSVLLSMTRGANAGDTIARVNVKISDTTFCDGSKGCMWAEVQWTTENCDDGSIKLTAYWNDGDTDDYTRRMPRSGTGSLNMGSLNPGAVGQLRLINRVRYFTDCKIVTGDQAGDLNVP